MNQLRDLKMTVRLNEFRDVLSLRRQCGRMEKVEVVDVESKSKEKEVPNTFRKVS